jgi:hypothetical protein
LPCCAFAACIVAQLLIALGAVRRTLFGAEADSAQRNPAVEWRLEPATARRLDPPPSRLPWVFSRWSFRSLAFAAALEVVIVLGAIYGFLEHVGHGVQHAERVNQVGSRHYQDVDLQRVEHDSAVDLEAAPSRSDAHPAHG